MDEISNQKGSSTQPRCDENVLQAETRVSISSSIAFHLGFLTSREARYALVYEVNRLSANSLLDFTVFARQAVNTVEFVRAQLSISGPQVEKGSLNTAKFRE